MVSSAWLNKFYWYIIDSADFAFFVAILQTKLRQKGSFPEVGNISGDPELFPGMVDEKL